MRRYTKHFVIVNENLRRLRVFVCGGDRFGHLKVGIADGCIADAAENFTCLRLAGVIQEAKAGCRDRRPEEIE
jgi:hypothetical protein